MEQYSVHSEIRPSDPPAQVSSADFARLLAVLALSESWAKRLRLLAMAQGTMELLEPDMETMPEPVNCSSQSLAVSNLPVAPVPEWWGALFAQARSPARMRPPDSGVADRKCARLPLLYAGPCRDPRSESEPGGGRRFQLSMS